jgi:hypothetical protein
MKYGVIWWAGILSAGATMCHYIRKPTDLTVFFIKRMFGLVRT